MKWTITLSCIVAFISISNSQIFNSGFENNNGTPLTDFTTINNDGLTVPIYAPVQDFNTEGWIQFYDGYDNKIAFSTSWYEPAGQSDDWLITPAIEIPNAGEPTLYWKGKSYDFENLDDYEIRVSTTTNDMSSFTETLLTVEGEQPFDYNSRTLDLSQYKGQTIYLAFVNTTFNGFYLAIDDLYISETSDCYLPEIANVTAHNLSENSFEVTWDPTGGITLYDTGLATFTGSVNSTGVQEELTKTYDNLQPATRYQFFLKNADCGSGWATPTSIWTAALLPYAYDFEFTEENYGEYDSDGWSSNTWINGSGPESQNGNGYVFNNTSTSFDKNDWIHSYPIKINADETVKITYFAKLGSESADPATLKLAVADEPNRDANFMELDSETIVGGDYVEYTSLFTASEDGVYYFGFGNVTPIVSESAALRLDNIQFTLESLSTNENVVSSLSVSPNPVKDYLYISSDLPIISAKLYSVDGKLVATYSNSSEIDFSSFSKGIYLLKINTEKGSTVTRIIK